MDIQEFISRGTETYTRKAIFTSAIENNTCPSICIDQIDLRRGNFRRLHSVCIRYGTRRVPVGNTPEFKQLATIVTKAFDQIPTGFRLKAIRGCEARATL